MMIVYNFDYSTGEYMGSQELTVHDIDQRSFMWLIPGNATTVEPPRCDTNTKPVWLGDRWVVLECIVDIPDELLEQCRKGVERMQQRPSGPSEKIK
jgi:hypothetical protein